MEIEKGTNAYFLSDCFGLKDETCIELGKKPLDKISMLDLITHGIKTNKKINRILKDIKTRNDSAKASGFGGTKPK